MKKQNKQDYNNKIYDNNNNEKFNKLYRSMKYK